MPEGGLTVHAACVVLGEAGVLIRGESGAGKSSLALGLIEAAPAHGLFGALVADDRVRITCAHGRLVARPHPAIAGRIELRGLGEGRYTLTDAFTGAALGTAALGANSLRASFQRFLLVRATPVGGTPT